jgi:hypothetical protein
MVNIGRQGLPPVPAVAGAWAEEVVRGARHAAGAGGHGAGRLAEEVPHHGCCSRGGVLALLL